MAARSIGPRTLAALLALAGSGPAMASSPPILPALVQPATHEHLVGKMVYAELITPDLQRVEPFYAGLLGWSFRDVATGRHAFTEVLLGGQQIAGVIQRPMPSAGKRHPAWLAFISTQDVDAAEKAATQNGATLLYGPRSFADLGRLAVLKDPQGAVFAMLSSSSGDPADIEADDGDWVWSSAITSDPQSDAAFYRSVFGYDTYDLTSGGSARHIILASGGYARASVNSFPADRPDAQPRWLNFVRVEDVAAMVAKVQSLGGSVLLQPKVDHGGSTIAIVTDPLGAAFGLMELSDSHSAGDAK